MALMGMDEAYGYKDDWSLADIIIHMDTACAAYLWLFTTADPTKAEDLRANDAFTAQLNSLGIESLWYERSFLVPGDSMKRILLNTPVVATFDLAYLFPDAPKAEPAFFVKAPFPRFSTGIPEKLRDEVVRAGAAGFFIKDEGVSYYSREKELSVILRQIFSKI